MISYTNLGLKQNDYYAPNVPTTYSKVNKKAIDLTMR